MLRSGLYVLTLAGVSLALMLSASAQTTQTTPASTERYSVVANGEIVGHLVATSSGARTDIEYQVVNNGRGPHLRHHITVDAQGLPTEWRIEGASLFGNSVSEHFTRANGRAEWSSQAEEGAQAQAAPALYVANDDTPWSLGLYARALLAAPDHLLNVLPGGTLRLDDVQTTTLGQGATQIPVRVERLTGLGLAATYIMLDAQNRLVAQLGGEVTVREGYEREVPRLRALAQSLELENYRALQSRLAHPFTAPVRIRNARIFDPVSGRLSGLSTVVVHDDVIAAVIPGATTDAAPANEYDIDAAGGTLVPGLHDMHYHSSISGDLLYIAAGVTSVRDMGNNNASLRDMMRQIAAGQLAGPRTIPDGFLEGRSPYSARVGIVADTLPQALDAVRWYSDHGYFEIKIYNSIHPDWVKPIADEAHRLGMNVTGHVPAFVTPDQAIEDGYNTIAHINQLMLGWLLHPGEDTRTPLRLTGMERAADLNLASAPVRHTIALMQQHHVALDTTAVTLETLMLSRARQIPASHAANLDHMPIGYQRYRKRSFVTLSGPEQDQRYREAFHRLEQTLLLLHRSGVQLLPGTDDGVGFTLHRELEIYVEAGISPAQVLTLDTLRCAQYLRQDQREGTIERGKWADFILIPGDPTRDISAVRQIQLVMKGGVAYFPSEIYGALGIRPFADPVAIRAPTAPDPYIGVRDADAGNFLFPGWDHDDGD